MVCFGFLEEVSICKVLRSTDGSADARSTIQDPDFLDDSKLAVPEIRSSERKVGRECSLISNRQKSCECTNEGRYGFKRPYGDLLNKWYHVRVTNCTSCCGG